MGRRDRQGTAQLQRQDGDQVFSPDGTRVLSGSVGQEHSPPVGCFDWPGHPLLQGRTALAFSPDGKRVLTGSPDKTARLWDISAIPQGSIFDIACAWLPDNDLSSLGKDYGLDFSGEAPICQKDADGRFTTPLPDTPTVKACAETGETPLYKQFIKLLHLGNPE